MWIQPPQLSDRRSGFTLVELMVVITIIAILAGLGIAFYPNFASQAREAKAAGDFQMWCNTAKQYAVRENTPYGIRLWSKELATSSKFLLVTQGQYIKQPDDFSSGFLANYTEADPPFTPDPVPPIPANTVLLLGSDVTGGFSDPSLWAIQPNDYLEIFGAGLVHRVKRVGYATPHSQFKKIPVNPSFFIETYTPIANGGSPFNFPPIPPSNLPRVPGVPNYRIIRQPRIVGDDTLELPEDMVIDLNTNLVKPYGRAVPFVPTIPPPLPADGTGHVDILFSPTGRVVTSGLSRPTMDFWIRRLVAGSPNDEFAGEPTLISIWSQTGFVGAYPIDPAGPNPYYFVK